MGSNTLTQLSDQTNRVMLMYVCAAHLVHARLHANAQSSSSLHACWRACLTFYSRLPFLFSKSLLCREKLSGILFFCCCFFKCEPFGDEIMHTRNRLTQFQPSRQRSYDAEGVQHTQKHKTFWKPGTCPCARTPSLLKYPAWN